MNIVVCGPAGAGKKKLIKEIRGECQKHLKSTTDILNVANRVLNDHSIHSRQDYRCDDKNFIDVQQGIITSQCDKERHIRGRDFITENCIITALVLLEICVGRGIVDEILKTNEVIESIERYKGALVLFLSPVNYGHDDGTCLILSQELWYTLRETYLHYFHQLHIPFLEMKSSDAKTRMHTVKKAIKGEIPLESSTLLNYHPKMNDEDRFVSSNFVFYLKKSKQEASCIKLPTIEITEHYSKQEWTQYMDGETNKFISKEGHEKLLCLDFDISVKSTVVQKMLLGGIFVNGHQYSFLGCSTSGLKSRKCFMWEGTSQEVTEILQRHGDFNAIKTVSKRLARISLLFSGVSLTNVVVKEENIIEKEDITIRNGSFNFTDGCGAIGKTMAKQLTFAVGADYLYSCFLDLPTSFELYNRYDPTMGADVVKMDYIPAVFQVRFQGYKGVLVLDRKLPDKAIMVRPSMKKFDSTEHPYIGVCDYSKPYTFGHLNKQFVMLLSGLGIRGTVFEEKQEKYLNNITKMMTDSESAIQVLQWENMFDLAQRINEVGGVDHLLQAEKDKLSQLQTKMVSKLSKVSKVSKVPKLKILIAESRNIFGVCDQAGVLDYGQCFLRLTISDKPMTIRGQVVVCKNPCYLLGDVRVLTAVDETDNPDIRKLHHLVDCIVFPTRGKRPHPNEIAGSDLDGDQYFVTWDEQLIPKSMRPPYDYPGADSKPTGTITQDKIISYFSKQNETQKLIGRVDKYFNEWADLKGTGSTACERLGQLFSKVIDASKTGEEIEIPKGLQPSNETGRQDDLAPPKYVWIKMLQKAKAFSEKFAERKCGIGSTTESRISDTISEEFVQYFAQTTHSNISEFQKLMFLWNYKRGLGLTNEETLDLLMEDFADYINFSVFSVEERTLALDIGIPSKILLNALNRSKIVSEDELNYFQMDSPLNVWKSYVMLQHNTFDWSYLLKALTTNDNTLLVFKMPDDVILELQIIGKLEMGIEQQVSSGTITGLLYSRHFGYKLKYILGGEYVLDLTRDTFQLYRNGKKNLTFVWLNATDRKSVKGRWNKRVCDEVRNALSVDLQRFNRKILEPGRTHPLINKVPFVMIEVYAQNCNGEIPYWDIYDVNDNLPVVEEMDTEAGSDSAFVLDMDSAFPKIKIDIDVESEEDLCQKLKEVSEDGNPYTFKSVLEKWLPRNLSHEIVYPFMEMLANLVSKVIPLTLPEEIKTVLTEITVILSDILKVPVHLLSVVSILCRLGLNDLKSQLLQTNLTQVIQTEYIDVLENWKSFVYLDYLSAVLFIEQLLLSWTAMTEQCEDLTEDNAFLRLYAKRYGILHLLNLLFEIDGHMVEYRKFTKESDRKTLTERQNSITFLKIDTTAENEPSVLSFYRTGALEQNSCKFKGQYVMISNQNSDQHVPEKQLICIGQIEKLNTAQCTISVKMCEKTPDILIHFMTSDNLQYWSIELIGNIVMYQRVVSAFKEIISRTELNVIFTHVVQSCNVSASGTKNCDQVVYVRDIQNETVASNDKLNESQMHAIQSALTNKVCMIQGPPGTGKTEVACQIIRCVVGLKKYEGILAVAETNVAVDNLTRRLRSHVSVIRVGPIEGIENDLYDVSLEGQVELIAEREAKKSKIRDQQGNVYSNTRIINRVLKAADVILTTCGGAGDTRLENFRFPFVLVDEATQTLETTLLCSLVHGAENLVMIGDPKQLGPVVKECPKNLKSPNLPDVAELSTTLFHRWFNNKTIPVSFLDVQHRMHPDIMKFPSLEFYENKLKAAKSVEQRLPITFPWPEDKPLCFVNVNGRERKYGTSYSNQDEIDVVGKVIDVLLDVHEEAFREYRLATHQIGIITLYQGQVQKLKDKIKHGVKISTVDGFQGQERDVIVVSTVRCNDRASLGFSDDPRRLNVLLTRAKRGLIVVGNKTTLRSSQIWACWLNSAPELPMEAIKPVSPETRPKKRSGANRPTKKTTKQQ